MTLFNHYVYEEIYLKYEIEEYYFENECSSELTEFDNFYAEDVEGESLNLELNSNIEGKSTTHKSITSERSFYNENNENFNDNVVDILPEKNIEILVNTNSIEVKTINSNVLQETCSNKQYQADNLDNTNKTMSKQKIKDEKVAYKNIVEKNDNIHNNLKETSENIPSTGFSQTTNGITETDILKRCESDISNTEKF